MNDKWRYTTTSITKYNPIFRDENGIFKKIEWISFFQIGQLFDGVKLTFESYSKTERKYIKAAIYFFDFHKTEIIVIKNLEKNEFSNYEFLDKEELSSTYDKISEGSFVSIEDLKVVVKLILRGFIWAELFDKNFNEITLRFGYDFYMYFNSNQNLEDLFIKVKELGLYTN